MIAKGRSLCYIHEVDLAVSGIGTPTPGSIRGLSIRNRAVRSELKTAVKAVRTAVEAKDVETAQAAANKAGKLLDKAASKGIIHKNQAAQRKSGVQKLVNTIK